MAELITKSRFARISKGFTFRKKLQEYASAKMISWALIEGTGLLTIVDYFLTGNYYILFLTCILFVFYFKFKPSYGEFVSCSGVSKEEIEKDFAKDGGSNSP